MSKSPSRAAYTLIELLVAVAIFASLTLLTFAVFTRSAASATKADELRAKTQAARSAVNVISHDFEFLSKKVWIDQTISPAITYTGFWLDSTLAEKPEAILALEYPDSKNGFITRRAYQFNKTEGTLTVSEYRNCFIIGQHINCDWATGSSPATSIIDSDYWVNFEDDLNNNYASYFDGLTVNEAQSKTPPQTGWLKIQLTLKPKTIAKDLPCSAPTVPSGTCYTITTTLSPGIVNKQP